MRGGIVAVKMLTNENWSEGRYNGERGWDPIRFPSECFAKGHNYRGEE